jgi:hypothetical protein
MSRLYGVQRFGLHLPPPALWLDLVGGQVDPAMAFARVGPDEVVSSGRLLTTVSAANFPVHEHGPLNGRCLGLRIYSTQGNLAKYSEDRSENDGYIIGGRTSIGAADGPDPRGGTGMQQVLETTDNGTHPNQTDNYAVTSGVDYMNSLWLAKLGRQYVTLTHVTSGGVVGGWATFDLDNGVVHASEASSTGRMENWGNGIYRCGVGYQVATASQNCGIWLNEDGADAATGSYIGDVTKGVYAWGQMFTPGNYFPPYIPTTSGTGTRWAPTAVMGPVSVGGVSMPFPGYSQSEGTLLVEWERQVPFIGSAEGLIGLSDGTADNFIGINFVGNDDTMAARVRSGGANLYLNSTFGDGIGQINRAALTWKAGLAKLGMDGVEETGGTPASIPALDTLHLGAWTLNSGYANAYLREVAYWPQYLPDAIESITA